MKALKIFLIVIFTSQTLKGQDYEVYITINLSDCLNCIVSLKKINQLLSNKKFSFVFREEDERTAKLVLKKQLKIELNSKNTIYSDSLFGKLNEKNPRNSSTLHILWKKTLIKSLDLAGLNEKFLRDFNTLRLKERTILSDTVLLSNSITSQCFGDSVIIFDRKFNIIYLIDKRKSFLIDKIEGSRFDKRDLYKCMFGDTSKFYARITKQTKLLEEYGKEDININHFSLNKYGELFLDLSFFYIQETNNEIGIIPASVLLKLSGQTMTPYKYKEPDFFNKSQYYGFLSNSVLKLSEGKLITKVAHDTPDTTKNFIAGLHLREKPYPQVVFEQFFAVKYPKFAFESDTQYMFVGGEIIYPFYFFYFENLYANIETGKYFKLVQDMPNTDWKAAKRSFDFSNYQLIDVISSSQANKFQTLIATKNKYFIVDIDTKDNTSRVLQEIVLPPKNNKKLSLSMPKFLNEHTLYFITPENKMIEILF